MPDEVMTADEAHALAEKVLGVGRRWPESQCRPWSYDWRWEDEQRRRAEALARYVLHSMGERSCR